MPRQRPVKELWDQLRLIVLKRDHFRCTRCLGTVTESTGHVDHKRSGKLGTNKIANLRTLCRRCHVLRGDKRHRGMIAAALKAGVIPPNWRELVWDDE